MTLKWQYPKDASYFGDLLDFEPDRAGKWYDQDCPAMLHQQAKSVFMMLNNSKLPSFLVLPDDGYICSKSLYQSIKKKHTKTTTYDVLVNKAGAETLRKYLDL